MSVVKLVIEFVGTFVLNDLNVVRVRQNVALLDDEALRLLDLIIDHDYLAFHELQADISDRRRVILQGDRLQTLL